jgi:hypothetical protein
MRQNAGACRPAHALNSMNITPAKCKRHRIFVAATCCERCRHCIFGRDAQERCTFGVILLVHRGLNAQAPSSGTIVEQENRMACRPARHSILVV